MTKNQKREYYMAELTDFCTSLQRQQSELVSKFIAQALEITKLKARVKFLEARQGEGIHLSGDDAPIKGRRLAEGEAATEKLSSDTEEIRLDEGEAAAKRVSDDTEDMAAVLTTMDAASGKEKMVESDTPKKKKRLQEQIDVQVARELEEEIARDMLKTSEEVSKDVKTSDEVSKEKIKELIQLVPIEEVDVEALQVKHLIIDWKVHTEGQRSYWKITRLGGSSASYQFFIDMLKQLDREDLNQLWALVKETLSVRQP
nr:hypothetical protein [Tanacetum cinerariifolium]